MEKGYCVWIHGNWGISHPNCVRFGDDKAKAFDCYESRDLGGAGCVWCVELRHNDRLLKRKFYQD